MNIKVILSLIVIIILFYNCKNEEKNWVKTENKKSTKAYCDFVLKYPNSSYAIEARSYLMDTLKKMHVKAMKIYQDEKNNENQRKKGALKIYKNILQINPNDAHALNNFAVLKWMSYKNQKDPNNLKTIQALFEKSFENANFHRISNSVIGWLPESKMVNLARPAVDRYNCIPLRDIVYENLSAINDILKTPQTKAISPLNLVINGIVVDTNDVPIVDQRFRLIEIIGKVDFNNLSTTKIVNKYGKIINPYADTDKEGRFSFKIPYDNVLLNDLPTHFFFVSELSKENNQSTDNPLVLSQKGNPLAVNVDENTFSIDIGKACLGIKQIK